MKAIKYCLNNQLVNLCQRALQLEELTDKIGQLLPAELVSQCKVSSFNKSCLVLAVPDANWATQIRYLLPSLRDKLRTEGMPQLSSIKVNIELCGKEYIKPKKILNYELKEDTKRHIVTESQGCHYEPLRAALINLTK